MMENEMCQFDKRKAIIGLCIKIVFLEGTPYSLSNIYE